MTIICLFGQRRHDPEIIELMCAWDDYCADANCEGMEEDFERAKKSWGDDLLESRIVEIQVDENKIRSLFAPVRLTGEIKK
jgi:hypothetical protein